MSNSIKKRVAKENFRVLKGYICKSISDKHYAYVSESLLQSKKFQSLTGNSKYLYICMIMECKGKAEFHFTEHQYKKYFRNYTSFNRARSELQANGFIEAIPSDGYRALYKFSKEWQYDDSS